MLCFDKNGCKTTNASHTLYDVSLNRNTDRHEALYCANEAHYHSNITGMYEVFCSLH